MLCKTCIYNNDRSHCEVPSFEDIIDCTVYAPKEHDKKYIISYNFSLNTRKGFKIIYYLMKLSQHDITTVIKDIIAVRHKSIDRVLEVCDKLEKENSYILQYLLQGG
uniref:Uncharacterized protein n=1 Tax=Geladintestivirus 3 TaxID=3233135 RepID=A0AAU8MJD7_9CAUD